MTDAERLAAIRERLAGHLAGTTRAETAEYAIHVAGDMAYLLSLVAEWEATAHRTRDALHALEARVEAVTSDEGIERAAKAIWYEGRTPPYPPETYTWEAMVQSDGNRADYWREDARRAVTAALDGGSE